MVNVEQYFCVEDCGTIIDHVIVDGQVVGAVAFGISNALHEELVYDEGGQLLTGTMMDYLVHTASDIPDIQTTHTETPSPFTQGGVKGRGRGRYRGRLHGRRERSGRRALTAGGGGYAPACGAKAGVGDDQERIRKRDLIAELRTVLHN